MTHDELFMIAFQAHVATGKSEIVIVLSDQDFKDLEKDAEESKTLIRTDFVKKPQKPEWCEIVISGQNFTCYVVKSQRRSS